MALGPPLSPDLLTARDVARWLRISERSVWRWTARGILPPPVRPLPHTTRWRVADGRAYLDRLAPRQPVAAGGGHA